MFRPCEWAPLADADPLPGDSDAIAVEGARLARLGEEMRGQSARLRQIGADTTLVGAYAEELRSAAGELATDLDKTADRYERVGSALSSWAPELAEAQHRTLQARTKAIAAADLRQRSMPLFEEAGWGQNVASALVDPAAASRLAGQVEAEAMLAEARRMLNEAVEQAQARGPHYATLIEEANEILKDGRWDNFKDWVDRNAEWIESYTDNLGWVATAAALGAIFLPGANVLVLAAVGITTLSAATHATLLATGNGSWADLGLDIFALATFGAGTAAARGLRSAQLAARTAAAAEASDAASRAVLYEARNAGRAATAVLSRPGSTPAAKAAAESTLRAIGDRAAQEGARAADTVLRQPLAVASRWETLAVGEAGSARAFNDLLRTTAQYSAAPGVSEAAARGAHFYGAAQISYLSGTAADISSKVDDLAVLSRRLSHHFVESTWVIAPPRGEFA